MKVLADPIAWLWVCSLVGGFVLFTRRGCLSARQSASLGAAPAHDTPPLPSPAPWVRKLRWGLLGIALLASASELYDLPARLLASLERPYLVDASVAAGPADAVLVLGGYGLAFPNHSIGLELNEAGDRLLTGLSLIREGKGQVLVLSSGSQGQPPEPLEGKAAKTWIDSWKLVATPVEVLGPSSNTRDEAVRTASLARQRGWNKIILVTSAWHLRRAVAVFKKTGLEVIPVGSDFQGSVALLQPQRFALVPRTSSLVLFKLWLEETLGYVFYRLRGWA